MLYTVGFRLATSSLILGLSSLTADVCFHQGRDFIQDQLCDINPSDTLFQSSGAVGNNLEDFVNESLIGSDLRVPRIDKVFHYHCKDGVELMVHVIGAREGREELLCWLRRGRAMPATGLGVKDSSDQIKGSLFACRIICFLP